MNAQQWRHAAKPIVLDMAAVLEEHRSMRFCPADVPPAQYRAFWAAVEERDPAALRRACRAIQAEAELRARRGGVR